MANRVTLVLAVIVLVGCATTENYKKIVESWMGADVNSLVRSWGAPTSTFQMPNGNTILVYERRGSFTTPMTVTPGQTTGYFIGNTYYSHTSPATITGGQTIPLWCRTEFEAEPAGRLVRWSFEGNTCRARAPKEED